MIASLDPSSSVTSQRMDWLEKIMVLDHWFVRNFDFNLKLDNSFRELKSFQIDQSNHKPQNFYLEAHDWLG